MNVGKVLKKWRMMSDLELRGAAQQIGISHSALHRLERGGMPDAATLITLTEWLWSEAKETPDAVQTENSTEAVAE